MTALTALRRRVLKAARGVKRRLQRQRPASVATATPETRSDTLFVGHTRFSVHQFGSRYFNATREGSDGVGFTEQEYTDWLYSDERMNPRTEIFTQLSLPQLAQAAEDFNVVHYVSFSPSLPKKHKDALVAAAERYDFLELNETDKTVSSTPTRNLIRKAAQKHGLESGPVGVYRLDDDDVLSVNYFHLMAPYVRESHIGWWASQGLGIAAIRVGDDFVYVRDYYYPKSAFGPLCIAGYDHGDVTHTQAPKHTIMDHSNPTILDSREPAYFHIRHRGQDSTLGGKPMPFYPEAMLRIRSQGPADLNQVRALFPLLADKLQLTPGREQEATELIGSDTTLGDEPLTFDWDRAGAVALCIELADGKKLNPQQLRVSFSTAQDGTSEISSDQEQEFFTASKVEPASDGYKVWVPHQSTGFGHLLVIEPPQGVQVKTLRLEPPSGEPLIIHQATAYPL